MRFAQDIAARSKNLRCSNNAVEKNRHIGHLLDVAHAVGEQCDMPIG
jgi:hypothetical protein